MEYTPDGILETLVRVSGLQDPAGTSVNERIISAFSALKKRDRFVRADGLETFCREVFPKDRTLAHILSKAYDLILGSPLGDPSKAGNHQAAAVEAWDSYLKLLSHASGTPVSIENPLPDAMLNLSHRIDTAINSAKLYNEYRMAVAIASYVAETNQPKVSINQDALIETIRNEHISQLRKNRDSIHLYIKQDISNLALSLERALQNELCSLIKTPADDAECFVGFEFAKAVCPEFKELENPFFELLKIFRLGFLVYDHQTDAPYIATLFGKNSVHLALPTYDQAMPSSGAQ